MWEVDGDEIVLPGGLGSGGHVVRVGDTVRRPRTVFTDAVERFLSHLESVGFDGAPRVLGIDRQGRSALTFLDGEVGIPPFPEWTVDDGLLESVADLQRKLHEAARSFTAQPDDVWDRANLGPVEPGHIVCHNDLCVENVVVRDGRAVGFIDFDFAAPADPMVDIAIAARHWIPVKDPVDLESGRVGVDQVARFRRFLDAHELDHDQRVAVVVGVGDFLDRAMISMKARADEGRPMYKAVWDGGYPVQNRRSRAWMDQYAAAVLR